MYGTFTVLHFQYSWTCITWQFHCCSVGEWPGGGVGSQGLDCYSSWRLDVGGTEVVFFVCVCVCSFYNWLYKKMCFCWNAWHWLQDSKKYSQWSAYGETLFYYHAVNHVLTCERAVFWSLIFKLGLFFFFFLVIDVFADMLEWNMCNPFCSHKQHQTDQHSRMPSTLRTI